jgi:hypothetical protein
MFVRYLVGTRRIGRVILICALAIAVFDRAARPKPSVLLVIVAVGGLVGLVVGLATVVFTSRTSRLRFFASLNPTLSRHIVEQRTDSEDLIDPGK